MAGTSPGATGQQRLGALSVVAELRQRYLNRLGLEK